MNKFKFYKQADVMDCGPSCLRMIAKHHGKSITLNQLRDTCGINRQGVSMLGISEAAEKLGFRSQGCKLSFLQLYTLDLPVILHWDQNHFVVLYKIHREKFYIADPAKGLITYKINEFIEHWIGKKSNKDGNGLVLILSPTPDFYKESHEQSSNADLKYLFKYLFIYKRLLIQLFVGLGVGSLLQVVVPFLTQSVVDIGINTRNLQFVYIILIAQTMLLMGRLSVDFIRSWILLHITTRINIAILTDFLAKLMRLPISFFDSKMTGDIMQRMSDQKRIESFLTGSTLSILFSMFNLVAFTFVLAYYDTHIFIIVLLSSILYFLWVILFLKRRRDLDFKRFNLASKNQSITVEIISGIQEIKLNNCEKSKRWEWERIQAKLFTFSVKSLSLGQIQQAGAFFLNEGKNIIITFLVAKSVIDSQMTIGGMMAIQYIVGQINSPVEQLLSFIQQFQDAKISLERYNEVYQMDDEEPINRYFIRTLPENKSIHVEKVTFSYPGAGNEPVLKDIDLNIQEGKTTAIVGMSGSGKTSLLKILLRFYYPQNGNIFVGSSTLDTISYGFWRSKCGAVMQDGFIFSDSIAKNIAVSDDYPDIDRLNHAIKVANIEDLIQQLPLGINTKIGAEGNGLSQGQKQRILIARSVYKDPQYLFFDEATNALDANNELIIMRNLQEFFKGRTVVVVAHRLSTVKNADHIVVLDKGIIVEQGNHKELTQQKGAYYQLVKNQLELGQ